MKKLNIFLCILGLAFLLVLLNSTASTAYIIYTNEAAFVAALSGPQSLVDFNSSPIGNINGNEFSAQGFIFDSPLSPPLGQLNIANYYASSNYLNIDRWPGAPGDDGNEDDLDVFIQGSWKAVGFRILDGSIPANGESITVYDTLNSIIYTRTTDPVSYFGIIADVPIGKISINELRGDVDDVGYDDFRLGNQGAPIPEPATMLLIGSGLIGLAGVRKKFKK